MDLGTVGGAVWGSGVLGWLVLSDGGVGSTDCNDKQRISGWDDLLLFEFDHVVMDLRKGSCVLYR